MHYDVQEHCKKRLFCCDDKERRTEKSRIAKWYILEQNLVAWKDFRPFLPRFFFFIGKLKMKGDVLLNLIGFFYSLKKTKDDIHSFFCRLKIWDEMHASMCDNKLSYHNHCVCMYSLFIHIDWFSQSSCIANHPLMFNTYNLYIQSHFLFYKRLISRETGPILYIVPYHFPSDLNPYFFRDHHRPFHRSNWTISFCFEPI